MKFGEYAHLMQLQEEGLLYMNFLPYFWGIEDEELRGDIFDGSKKIERGPKVTIGRDKIIFGKWIMGTRPPYPEKINIFCMYALQPYSTGKSFPIDIKNFRFGKHALVLTNNDEFLRRIELNLNSQKIPFDTNVVEYVNDNYRGEMGLFRKLDNFAYQSEWRLVCYDGPNGVRQIKIGSIKDISVIIPSDMINKEINVEIETNIS